VAIAVVDCVEAFRDLNDEWNALSRRSPTACLFNSFGWIEAWWDAFAADDASMHVICVRDDSRRLTAVLPLMRIGSGIGARRRLKSIFNFHSNRTEVLVDPDRPDALAELVAFLAGEHALWDVLELVWMPEDSPLFRLLAGAVGEELHVHAVRTNESPYLDLSGSYRNYYEARFVPKKRRQDRWALRQVEKLGGRLELIRDSASLHATVDAFLAVEDLGWKGRLGSSMNHDPRVRAFVHDIAERAADDALLIVMLSIEERAAAFLFGLEWRGTFNFLKTSYDPAFSALSPGRLVINRAIEESFARNLRRFDFLGAADDYKLRYTDSVRPHSTIFLYNSGVLSRIRRAVKRRFIPFARHILGRETPYVVLMDR
jgi:CelD/BcsL family acetyltransferase involved in cellulose biosynthesis